MINSNGSTTQLQDYALGLLSPGDKRQVEQQIAGDPTLLAQLQQERQVSHLVKGTLRQTSQIDNGRLARLMPPMPKRQPKSTWQAAMSRQLAMVSMLVLLLFAGWQWQNSSQPTYWPGQPTFVAVTATQTNTPAPTETQTMPTETAAAKQTAPTAVMTPEPPPTPIAAVSINTN